jgi:hypothetical protein
MGKDQETISVAELSDGPPAGPQPNRSVSLPVVEILTGRGFVTGKSGSGKSNTASVIAEKLLDSGFGMLIVDIDGEYYGLKEEYEILHVGADEECDIQVTVDHAEKIASLALEQNVPIILDVSSFLDEDEAEELLTEVSKQLFAKEKKLKQPFLMLVEEVHEWIPEKGSMGECGRMLIKVGKRGRKHGLGMVGISQRPADVKKDFITQCDWLVWHRLTWNNDTKVVSRIIDGEYADAVEDLDDGEAFLMNDWSETVRRVQFHRKQTFDAGATPGLDDVDRPDLKSVSSDLVSELESISEARQQTEDRIAELRAELDQKNSRIAELETELQDARDMSRMADQFVEALVGHVEGVNPGRTERDRQRRRRARQRGDQFEPDGAESGGRETATTGHSGQSTDGDAAEESTTGAQSQSDQQPSADDAMAAAAAMAGGDGLFGDAGDDQDAAPATANPEASVADAADGSDPDASADGSPAVDSTAAASNGDSDASAVAVPTLDGLSDPSEDAAGTAGTDSDPSAGATDADVAAAVADEVPDAVEQLRAAVAAMQPRTRLMLRYYRDNGPAKPADAHLGASGDGDRTTAYAHNRTLRTHGLIQHVGRGLYGYTLPELVSEECDADLGAERRAAYVDHVEASFPGLE